MSGRTYVAEMKSSKQFFCLKIDSKQGTKYSRPKQRTLFSRQPAKCHLSPNSPPPLMLGTARMKPYFWANVSKVTLKNGLMEIENPP